MPPWPTVGTEDMKFFDCPSNRPSLTPILRNSISPYLLEGFRRNLPQMFTTRVGIVGKVFKVTGQRSRSYLYKLASAMMAEHTF